MLSSLRSGRPRAADRPRASPGTARGALWTLLLAADFFWLSNPLALIGSFDQSLRCTVLATAVAVLVSVPWLRLPGIPWVVLAFLGLAALSSTWSLSPGSTWHAVGLYALVAAVAVLVAANASVSVLADGLTLGGVLVVAMSYYALAEGLPGAAVPPGSSGFMAGVGTNRNILAYTLVLALAAAVSVAPRSVLGRVARAACVAVIAVNVVGTESGTGALAAAAVIATALAVALHDALRRRWMRTLFGVLLAALAVVVVLDGRTIALSLGKNPSTLSGRVPLWQAIVEVMQEGRLSTGYGWGAVWGHPWAAAAPNPVLNRIQAQAGFPAAHGHDSFLDVLPELGLAGVALCVVVYLRVGFQAFRVRRPSSDGTTDPAASRFLLVGLVGHLTLGLAEPLFTIPVGWFVLVLLVCAVDRGRSLAR